MQWNMFLKYKCTYDTEGAITISSANDNLGKWQSIDLIRFAFASTYLGTSVSLPRFLILEHFLN